jgi:trehalose synthase
VGADGVTRRWVYLHYFKEGQPSLNWLDPSFVAQQLVLGDALHSVGELGVGMVRLDANGFLGIERQPDGTVLSEGHPLSLTGNQLIAGMVRKVGGFSFQELNLTVDDIAFMSQGGADLSYDFITRPAYHHALVTGDTEFLRLMLRTMHEFEIDPASLIHALQNHDELTVELVHFWTLHKDDLYEFGGEEITGTVLRDRVRSAMYERLSSAKTSYNLRFVTNGISCTTASVITAALGIPDLSQISDDQRALIQQIHLLLVMYNALQPGVFALSGWDLVGALPLESASVADLIADGDTRWINRGAYDLMNVNPMAERSAQGIPKATLLYGPLAEQLQQDESFVMQLKHLLDIRQEYRIFESRQIAIPEVKSPALLVMVHELPDELGIAITMLNFGAEPIRESVAIPELPSGTLINLINGKEEGQIDKFAALSIQLDGYSGTVLYVPR